MAAIRAGSEIGKVLIEVLGLPKHTREFELRVAVDEAVTVYCEYHPELPDDKLGELTTALYTYLERVPIAPTREATSLQHSHKHYEKTDERMPNGAPPRGKGW